MKKLIIILLIIITLLTVFVLSSCNDKKVCAKHQDTMNKDSSDYPCYKTPKAIKF